MPRSYVSSAVSVATGRAKGLARSKLRGASELNAVAPGRLCETRGESLHCLRGCPGVSSSVRGVWPADRRDRWGFCAVIPRSEGEFAERVLGRCFSRSSGFQGCSQPWSVPGTCWRSQGRPRQCFFRLFESCCFLEALTVGEYRGEIKGVASLFILSVTAGAAEKPLLTTWRRHFIPSLPRIHTYSYLQTQVILLSREKLPWRLALCSQQVFQADETFHDSALQTCESSLGGVYLPALPRVSSQLLRTKNTPERDVRSHSVRSFCWSAPVFYSHATRLKAPS